MVLVMNGRRMCSERVFCSVVVMEKKDGVLFPLEKPRGFSIKPRLMIKCHLYHGVTCSIHIHVDPDIIIFFFIFIYFFLCFCYHFMSLIILIFTQFSQKIYQAFAFEINLS